MSILRVSGERGEVGFPSWSTAPRPDTSVSPPSSALLKGRYLATCYDYCRSCVHRQGRYLPRVVMIVDRVYNVKCRAARSPPPPLPPKAFFHLPPAPPPSFLKLSKVCSCWSSVRQGSRKAQILSTSACFQPLTSSPIVGVCCT